MAHYEAFRAVEALQAASEAAGWQCEYRQIEAGLLKAKSTFKPVGGSSLICETSNRRIELAARTPDAVTTALVPLPGSRVLVNGRQLSDDRIIILGPGIDCHAVSSSDAEVWSIHLSNDLLDDSLDIDRRGTQVIEDRPDLLTEFRAAINFALEPGQEIVLDHLDTHFANLFQKLLSSDAPATRSEHYNRRRKRKALFRALEFIEAHLAEPLRMNQICNYAGVSQSTLERLFRREFQLTPSNYVRARRLDAVRRELTGGLDISKTIADVAIAYGLPHLGRFSSAYRRQFGRLPSEDTIRSRN